MSFWSSKRITVTGGAGFLGFFVVEKLRERGCRDVFVPRSSQYDLVAMEAVKRMYRDARPDIVIHLAARVGGIGANRSNPASRPQPANIFSARTGSESQLKSRN
jgi:GDP-L-fucose synthase